MNDEAAPSFVLMDINNGKVIAGRLPDILHSQAIVLVGSMLLDAGLSGLASMPLVTSHRNP